MNNENKYIENLDTLKHFPSSAREWDNSIFVYNKDAIPLVPHISRLAINFIKNYFSLYNWKIEAKIRRKIIKNKHRRLSSNRIYLSKGEFKHTNNKVIITLYTFNRQKSNYLLKLKKRFLNKFLKKRYIKKYYRKIYKKKYFTRTLETFNKFYTNYSIQFKDLNHYNEVLEKNKNIFLSRSNKFLSNRNHVNIRIKNRVRIKNTKLLIKKLNNIKYKSLLAVKKASYNKEYIIIVLDKLYKLNKIKSVSRYSKRMLNYIKLFYTWRIKKYLRKMVKYIYYKQLIYINKSKFNYTYLQYLKTYLQLLFNKNVEFNFINLKKFYLNSSILSESVLLKIQKNRSWLLKYITRLKDKINIKKKVFLENKTIYYNIERKKFLKNYVINNLKYRHITGFRLEAKGRLTKRHKAARSITKLKYKGNLFNIDSTSGGLSSIFLKGNLDSNLQYTKLNAKTNIGSFGLKGWVSGN